MIPPIAGLTPELTEAVTALVTAGGAALKLLFGTKTSQARERAFEETPGRPEGPKWSPAQRLLVSFASLVVIYGAIAVLHFWPWIQLHGDLLVAASGIFLMMVLGMFVQVVSSNFKNGRELLDISMSQLVYPMLFAPIVYYPIWIVSSSNSFHAFSWYAAFLNGFFWESVVSSARLPGSAE